jgi:hypothetical protein
VIPAKLVNLTPHRVRLITSRGALDFDPSPVPARLEERLEELAIVGGVPLYAIRYGEPQNLPSPEEGCLLIVSSVIRQALPHRFDLVSPCSLVRDSAGKIKGAAGLCGSHWAQQWITR